MKSLDERISRHRKPICEALMKWPCWLLVWAASVSSLALGQVINEQKKTVTFMFGKVHTKDRAGNPIQVEIPLGTGFFVIYPDPRGGPDFAFVYLVTAKHVLQDTDGTFLRELSLRMSLEQPIDGKQIEFLAQIPVTDDNGHLIWFRDQLDAATDVAILPLLPDRSKFDYKCIPISMFADTNTLQTDKVAEGDTLYFIGLMSQYYGERANYPVVRRGTLAMMTDEPILTATGKQHAFIAELASWPGNSGAPVFLNLAGLRDGGVIVGNNLKFLGVVSGSFVNKLQGVVVDATTVRQVTTYIQA